MHTLACATLYVTVLPSLKLLEPVNHDLSHHSQGYPAHLQTPAALHETAGARRTPFKVEKLPDQPPGNGGRPGSTLLHGVPATCISHALSVLAALFPSSEVDWRALSTAAAASRSCAPIPRQQHDCLSTTPPLSLTPSTRISRAAC